MLHKERSGETTSLPSYLCPGAGPACRRLCASYAVGSPTWTLDEFPLPSDAAWPQALTSDGDGNLWFVEVGRDQVGRLTPAQATPGAGSGISELGLTLGAWPQGISAAPDGSIWFAEFLSNALGIVAAGDAITEYLALGAQRAAG